MKIVLGTRGSLLAVQQSEDLVAFLRAAGHEVAWKRFTTHGDQWLAGPLGKEEGAGFFTKELEDALVSRDVDLLIHSFKDVALERPEGIVTACVPVREDPADWLVMRPDAPKNPAPAGQGGRAPGRAPPRHRPGRRGPAPPGPGSHGPGRAPLRGG